ncbi:MAG: zinc-dependent metalloprotease [Bacteroidetes bacterium]|nr:zinc-dependent metalloprotease [Bacteroidota bacterium]
MLVGIESMQAQNRRDQAPPPPAAPAAAPAAPAAPPAPPKTGPRSYKELITPKAKTSKGLFNVHKIDDKFYFEIKESLFGREIMAITRFSKVAGGGGVYGGELANQQVVKFEKGPDNKVFMRVVTVISVADSSQPIYKAVKNSNLDPIAASFDIKAFGADSTGAIIDVTDYFKGDNQAVSMSPAAKRRLSLTAIQSDKSYIESIKSFPINTEVRSVKTFGASAAMPGMGAAPSPFPSASLPAANAAGVITLEINNSFILLPEKPMQKRLNDIRTGYFVDDYTVYSDDQQKTEESSFIVRWKLQPKKEDVEKWKRGEMVEPEKPIVYYIDPATPKKWRSYLIQGVNDWQAAFEKAGFKNAIMGKEWPEGDSTMSLEDARYSVIRYFASDIQNAYGPNVHDPRSGEILESHIGWYHNVMSLLHDWYFVQTAAVDPEARKMKFDDDLMGNLIRFVSSHEVGHTLGLRHNMGSSSKTPVEKLRDKAWVEANGHTASIMDYARFNYVAQPEDNISRAGLFPRIGEYDKWAIEWGYGYGADNEEDDKKQRNKLYNERLSKNPRVWFGTYEYGNLSDPRTQSEDLGDNAMKASDYGVKNLKRIMAKLPEWTKEEGDRYQNLQQMYGQVVSQFNRYLGHVARNIGGYYETPKSVEQAGDVFEVTPKAIQKEAVAFVNNHLFTTPEWMLNYNILNKINSPVSDQLSTIQDNVLASVLSASRLTKMAVHANRFPNAYTVDELLNDMEKNILSEWTAKKSIDGHRRNLQKSYVERMIALLGTNAASPAMGGFTVSTSVDSKKTDVYSVVRGHLNAMKNASQAAASVATDNMTKYHLQDITERIKRALEPK